MSNFPTSLDDDGSIFRVDDNLSELGTDVINQLRSAVFAIEGALGLIPQGSLGSTAARLNVSLNADGTIKASALSSIGLVTLPITNSQVGTNAGILESKLSLDYGTSNLNTLIQANTTLLNSLASYEAALETKVNSHIAGGPASNLRHVGSHIDLNEVPSDSRDGGYAWDGLFDKDGYALTATDVTTALFQINTNLTRHQNQELDAHPASAISVDASNFSELLNTSESVQDVLDNIDRIELLQLGTHRATQHTNGVPKAARSLNLSSAASLGSDGYNLEVVSSTACITYAAHNPPGNIPLDNVSTGDNIVKFSPASNAGSIFDAKFSQVKIGDIIRINYGTAEDIRRVESIRYIPGSEWVVRIDGVNLRDSDGYIAYARIDRPLYDANVQGVLAVAAANATPLADYSILGSVIIGDPRGATALGMNFDPSTLSQNNYLLYLELYPTGNPADHVIKLPGIDVTGNLGTTGGKYTLDSVVMQTNNSFRKTGFNFRFIAFSTAGNFGIMLADSIDGASFAIINGSNSTGTLAQSTYVKNVVGDVYGLHVDPLGFGAEKANLASPTYQSSWVDSTAALIPTKIIHPVKSRNYVVNGRPFDTFKSKEFTTNGFWPADISSKNITGTSVEVTYKINIVLESAGLKPGKTIVVQPAVAYSDPSYSDNDYGRFIIKSVVFNNCQCVNDYTLITVINGVHGTGNPLSTVSDNGLPVRLYFSEDSVSFNDQNIIDNSETSVNYHRFHEIYVTDHKTTFSHERARMAYVTETSQLIDTFNWNIVSVSPKFRGYKDSTNSNFNKYIRLYITNYNITTGEYDGYLGQRNPVTNQMTNIGPLIRSRKNVSTKFYDDTNIDYIELIFTDENTTTPGSTISINKWIDIEIFNSLLLDQELLPLASCEVNWVPAVGKNIVDFVKNLKQYGSISELEFTQSAINFITSGEKYLHGNGVIAGFDAEVDLTINKFLLKGGVALVNGKIVTSNNYFINPPTILPSEYGGAGFIDWAICVDEYGAIKLYPLSVFKTQFFVTDTNSSQAYYVPSYSFLELSNEKSLTLLYILSVGITSGPVTILFDSFSDARKFIKNETSLIPLTWIGKDVEDTDESGTSELSGHFNSINQVITWINRTKSPSNIIKIKGKLTFTETLILRYLAFPTVFDGEGGAVLTFKSATGILLPINGNVTFKNITFNWLPPGLGYAVSDNVNLDTSGTPSNPSSNALIYKPDGGADLVIDNCIFTGQFPQTQRPPYIALITELYLKNIRITNNNFFDSGDVVNQCAIAIVCLKIKSDILSVTGVENVTINNNSANNNQSIIVSLLAAASINNTTFWCNNVNITNNNVGAIGYLNTSYFTNAADIDNKEFKSNGINISNNSATFIGTLDTTGKIPDENIYSLNTVGSGDVIIKNNFVSMIVCNFYPNLPLSGYDDFGQTLLISENKLKCPTNYSTLANIYAADNTNGAISIRGWVNRPAPTNSFTLVNDTRVAQILNNHIVYSISNPNIKTLYDYGIKVESCGGIVQGNIIKGFNTIGIYTPNNVSRDRAVKMDIKDNQLYNPIDTAQYYINFGQNTSASINYTVINNSFDKTSTNGSPDFMIGTDPNGGDHIVDMNINHISYAYLRAYEIGKIVLSIGTYQDPLFNNSPAVNPDGIRYYATGSTISGSLTQLVGTIGPVTNESGFTWLIPLHHVNRNSRFISAKIYFTQSGASGYSNDISLDLIQNTYFSETVPIGGSDITYASVVKTFTGVGRDFIELNTGIPNGIPMGKGLSLGVSFTVNGGSGVQDRTIAFEPLKYTFTY